MIRCPKCNAANKGRETCGACGAPLTPEQSTAESRPVVRVSDAKLLRDHLRPWEIFSDEDGLSDGLMLARDLRDSRAREAKQAEEIARLTAALAEAESGLCTLNLDLHLAQAALAEAETECQALTAAIDCHDTGLKAQLACAKVALAEAQAQAERARNAAFDCVKALQDEWEEGLGRGREINALDEVLARLRALKTEPHP